MSAEITEHTKINMGIILGVLGLFLTIVIAFGGDIASKSYVKERYQVVEDRVGRIVNKLNQMDEKADRRDQVINDRLFEMQKMMTELKGRK